jgi:hypothetical protein
MADGSVSSDRNTNSYDATDNELSYEQKRIISIILILCVFILVLSFLFSAYADKK